MIDHPRPYETQNMCDLYYPATSPAPARLDDFQVFKKGASHIYGNYYSTPTYDIYSEPEMHNTENVYLNLVSSRECHPRDEWKYKAVSDWNENDTVSWLFDTAQMIGLSEYEVPFQNFQIIGLQLSNMRIEELSQRMSHPNVDPCITKRFVETVYDKIHHRISEDILRQSPIFRYAEGDQYHHNEPTMLDLDSLSNRSRLHPSDYTPNDTNLIHHTDSSDDAEDMFSRLSGTASPECSSYVSDGSKSGDEDTKRKIFKRPPGRPKGSGRKTMKRPRSVSVPEFLRNLLLDPKYCPSIIKWEEHSIGKFRFVKPDEVAKLWGKMKQNDNMTFEKFSRAMRYHYRQSVLVSVPTARLVYQFGLKGPDFKTDNPNFCKVKTELDINEITYP